MKRIAIVGAVGAGKPRYLMPCRELFLARKRRRWNLTIVATSIHPGIFQPSALVSRLTTLQDVDTLIYVHAANDTESRLPPGLLDIGSRKHLIVAISKTDLPDANVAAVRQLLDGMGFQAPVSPSTVAIRKASRR